MNSVILIPARMEAERFPGKPLAKILGRPMIEWVYEAVVESSASDVFVVTDSPKIIEAVEKFGGAYIKTSDAPRNGTERCKEAIELLTAEGHEYDVIINVQGDEPLISSQEIDLMLDLFEDEEIDIATFIAPIQNEKEYRDKNVVKAVTSLFDNGFCDINYFSRSPIPFMEKFEPDTAFKHIGIYGFTATAFEEIGNLVPTDLEKVEKLEQLRWLQNHLLISGLVTTNPFIGVDTPAVVADVENILKSRQK